MERHTLYIREIADTWSNDYMTTYEEGEMKEVFEPHELAWLAAGKILERETKYSTVRYLDVGLIAKARMDANP